jgi:hypothetical protein
MYEYKVGDIVIITNDSACNYNPHIKLNTLCRVLGFNVIVPHYIKIIPIHFENNLYSIFINKSFIIKFNNKIIFKNIKGV